MLYYLDTCIVIYAVEGVAPFQQRTHSHIAAVEAEGHRFVFSDLTRGECLVYPLGRGDAPLLLAYEMLFLSPNLSTIALNRTVHERAARIRGVNRYENNGRIYGLADSLHLAAAIESGCNHFLTNDGRLNNFPGIDVQILP